MQPNPLAVRASLPFAIVDSEAYYVHVRDWATSSCAVVPERLGKSTKRTLRRIVPCLNVELGAS